MIQPPSPLHNRQFRLRARPVGMVQASDFELATSDVREPAEGEAVVRVQYLSLDPAMPRLRARHRASRCAFTVCHLRPTTTSKPSSWRSSSG